MRKDLSNQLGWDRKDAEVLNELLISAAKTGSSVEETAAIYNKIGASNDKISFHDDGTMAKLTSAALYANASPEAAISAYNEISKGLGILASQDTVNTLAMAAISSGKSGTEAVALYKDMKVGGLLSPVGTEATLAAAAMYAGKSQRKRLPPTRP